MIQIVLSKSWKGNDFNLGSDFYLGLQSWFIVMSRPDSSTQSGSCACAGLRVVTHPIFLLKGCYSQLISNRPRRFEILRPKWLDYRCMPLHSFVVNHCCKALHAGYLCRFGQRLCRYLDSFPKEDSSVNVDKKTLIKIVHKYS